MFEGSGDDSMREKRGGIGARAASTALTAAAAFTASFSTHFLIRISSGVGKLIFIMFSANFAIKASSSNSGSMNSRVPKSLINAHLITNGLSTYEGIRLTIPDWITTKSFQRLDCINR
ncbi:hypothetical protein TIFTF001_044808 [Ficus carica]|uniref:Uncharacterized protein n=1 Tax=Ficus carica TaxID=3494 RepID=A0AA87ZHV7_FICCA|nr:hypothetical protein TIFTF001_044808 [Ficus carica]